MSTGEFKPFQSFKPFKPSESDRTLEQLEPFERLERQVQYQTTTGSSLAVMRHNQLKERYNERGSSSLCGHASGIDSLAPTSETLEPNVRSQGE
jgi:hypothetical protein